MMALKKLGNVRVQALNLVGRVKELRLQDLQALRVQSIQERLVDFNPREFVKLLRTGPLFLTLIAVMAVISVGSTSMFGARVSMEVNELVDVQALSFLVTTYTTDTLPRELLGTVHTYGKDYTVKFMISNSSLELGPYFEDLTVLARLEAGGGSWNAEASTIWTEGVGATTGSIVVDQGYSDYTLYVTVSYGSKDLAGITNLGLSIWAEG